MTRARSSGTPFLRSMHQSPGGLICINLRFGGFLGELIEGLQVGLANAVDKAGKRQVGDTDHAEVTILAIE